jgi:hypothetical protein
MKTQEQINFNANLILQKCKASTMHYPSSTQWKQFRHCNAYISSCINNRYFLIRSYNTIVGVIDDQNSELYELGKWSKTTSKQVSQIFNMPDIECYKQYGFSKLDNRYLTD